MLEALYTAEEMKAVEAGHDVPTLMERAGRAVAEEAIRRYPDARSFGAVCGGGANGGDGRIALEVLRAAGREAQEGASGDVLIDALFGTGFHGEPRPEAAALIEELNAAGRPVVAIDLPSGVNADTGEIAGAAVQAHVTVTMHGRKVGLEVAPGRFHAGEVVVADIGLEPRETATRLVTREILGLVPPKGERDNKYTAGAVLVVGGSAGMGGAVTLAATAAFRADAGYVTVCSEVEPHLLEAVKRPLGDAVEAAAKARALGIGPGLGRSPEKQALVRRLLEETDLPAVVDADALFGLEPFVREAPTVLTPHAGELGPPARPGLGLGRRASARGRPGCGGAVRLRVPAQGGRHARRGTVGGDSRRPAGASVACDSRDGRRAHRRDLGVPGEGRGRPPRGGRRSDRLRRGGRTRAGAGPDRLRRCLAASARARL